VPTNAAAASSRCVFWSSKKLDPAKGADRASTLADTELVDRMVTATRPGDVIADADAMLLPEHGMKRLIGLLVVRPVWASTSSLPP